MRLIQATSTAIVVLLLGTSVPAYAQRGHDRQDDKQGRGRGQEERGDRRERPQQRGRAEDRRQQNRPEQRAEQVRRERQQEQRAEQFRRDRQREQARRIEPGRREPRRAEQHAAEWQRQRGWLRNGGWEGRRAWQEHRARRWESDHRTWVQRGGYGGHFIPAERFRLHFGRQHWFRIHSRPVMYMGYPRFSYAGFSFMLVDPWPEYWAEDWYDSDDVYVDYDDGYYLHSRRHPGISLAITVVM